MWPDLLRVLWDIEFPSDSCLGISGSDIKETMSRPAEREKMLAEMTRADKAELLCWIVRDLSDDFPGIEQA